MFVDISKALHDPIDDFIGIRCDVNGFSIHYIVEGTTISDYSIIDFFLGEQSLLGLSTVAVTEREFLHQNGCFGDSSFLVSSTTTAKMEVPFFSLCVRHSSNFECDYWFVKLSVSNAVPKEKPEQYRSNQNTKLALRHSTQLPITKNTLFLETLK